MLRKIISFILIIFLTSHTYAQDNPGTATLALEELLRLHKEVDKKNVASIKPPINYTVSSFIAKAQIVGDAIEAKSFIKITVLDNGWTIVPILESDADLNITNLPIVNNGDFLSSNNDLKFITHTAGTYEFSVSFIKTAKKDGVNWLLKLRPSPAAITKLELTYDSNLFKVNNNDTRREGDSLIIYSKNHALQLSWKNLQIPSKKVEVLYDNTPVEPVVTTAYAIIVTTLDGQRFTRILYRLRVQGKHDLAISIPNSQQLTKVYLNGISIPFAINKQHTTISISPPRLGEQNAILELVIKEQHSPMALAGNLQFLLPKVSWGINEYACMLYLPKVFNYQWNGGSLAPGAIDNLPNYTFNMPTPGKSFAVTQQLVNDAPDAVMAYTVDLTGNYFN
ncbi:MAG: hypothetical protein JW841_16960 [Deltaproteobacteria bacterium]|nr:hypothetical protein [Deltaproteobacteria bacterium]